MSVKIVLVTHEKIGASLIEVAQCIVNPLPTVITNISVHPQCDPQKVIATIQNKLNGFDSHEEILLITDLFGATPCNIAQHFNGSPNIRLLSGLNLPMLIRALNYFTLPLDELCLKVIAGGQNSILLCEPTN